MCHTTLSNSPDKKTAIRAIKPAVFWVLYLWIVLQLCFSLSTEDISLARFSFSTSDTSFWLQERCMKNKFPEFERMERTLIWGLSCFIWKEERQSVCIDWVAEKMEGNRGKRQHADRWMGEREKRRQGEKVAMIRGGEQQLDGVPFFSYRRVRVTVALEYNFTHEHILYPRIVRWES